MMLFISRGLVRPTAPHRQAPIQALIDVWPSISDVLRSREWMLLEKNRLVMEAALDEVRLAEKDGPLTDWRHDRLRFLLEMTETAQDFLRLIIRLRSNLAVKRLSRWVLKTGSFLRNLHASS